MTSQDYAGLLKHFKNEGAYRSRQTLYVAAQACDARAKPENKRKFLAQRAHEAE